MKINKEKALEVLLLNEYRSEWEIIEGRRQHPQGLNFMEWMHSRGIISDEELEKNNPRNKDED